MLISTYIEQYFGVSQAHLPQLESLFKEERLEKGEFHTKQGDRHGRLSFITSGYLRIHSIQNEKDVTQWISSPTEFTTDLGSLVFGQAARRNIEALTPVVMYSISQSDYQSLSQHIPEWQQLEKLFLAKCFMTIEDRVSSFIALSAEERYLQLFEHKRELFQHIPLQYLASMLGMTPETFSRVRKKTLS
ncbi:Crp/Fnr family transcriptional regulator [Sanyastnella coralliicola]|uniref:Crp/Fnr family transcriptional regulator n=1 Tax=Sanyastnella coralliicola TaxID=3069118 RepID=UPI0027BA5AB0|nr:Crp/Fnr family transcriptional regulator [Longitalea sp. SCSIO 12813]